MQKFAFCIVMVLAGSPRAILASEAASLADRCLQGISKLQSYDVTYSWELVVYRGGSDRQKAHKTDAAEKRVVLTKRDVLALGLGRRVEDQVGTEHHSISIIDWQTASSAKTPLSRNINDLGERYAALFNPDCWGFSLLELLRDKQSTIRTLEPSSAHRRLGGFEVVHPKMDRPVRVWVDPSHGYMPALIEKCTFDNSGQTHVFTRAEVQEFTRIGGAGWAPLKGAVARVQQVGPNSGKPMLAEVVAVDTTRSSWNSIDSAELFVAASLPRVNHLRPSGWKQCLPADTLGAVRRAEQRWKAVVAEHTSAKWSSVHLLIAGANVLLLVGIIAVAIRRYRRKGLAAA